MSSEKSNILGAFSLKKYIAVCLKYWYVFLISVLACLFVAGVLAIVRPQKVEVLSQLMLKEDAGGSSLMMAGQIARSFSLGDMFGGSSSTDNETFVIKSHTVFVNTAKDLGLNVFCYTKRFGILSQFEYTNAPLTLTAAPEMSDTISRSLMFKLKRDDDNKFSVSVKVKRSTIAKASDLTLPFTINTPYGDFTVNKTDHFDKCQSKKFVLVFCSYDAAASTYEELVKAYVPDRKSDFIDLSFVTDDPAFGKKLLSTVIKNYEDISNVYKTERSMQSLSLVDDRLASLATELKQSEVDLETFKKQNKLTEIEADAQYLLTKTGSLESALLEAQTNYEVIKLTKEFISNPENNYSLIPELFVSASSATGDPGNISLIAQYNQMILERMQLLSSAKSNNAAVKQIDLQIDALRSNIITSVNRAYQNSSVVLRDLKNEDLKNKARLGELPTIEREYIVLKRDNLLQEQIYLFLLQQREELNMSLNSRSFPAQVIDYPYVLKDQPGLSTKLKLALGFVIGVLIAMLYLFFKKMNTYPITSLSELKSTVKAPVLQDIAKDNSSDASTFALAADCDNAEAFRKLRSDVQFALSACDGKTVVVTSVNDNEGKTYVATNLAASLALAGKSVALVDVSLRDPKVAANLGINEHKRIFSDFVYGQTDRVDGSRVDVDKYSSMEVVATQAHNDNPSDILASDRFAELISTLRQNSDYVVIDSARIKDYCDIYYLTDLADLTVVVCRSGIITADDVNLINDLYSDGRLKRIAVVDNAFKA